MDFSQHLLSILVWLPIIGGIMLLLVGDGNDVKSSKASTMRTVALGMSVLTFVLSIALYKWFDNTATGMQFVERFSWIPALDVHYYLGVDGISAPLILLTTFITPLVVITSWDVIKVRPAQYFAAFLILEGLMIGVFSALDGLLFYVFWEAMLVPMFLIIGVWGGERRVYATLKFFLYTFLGSVLMLVAFIYLYGQTGSFDMFGWMNVPLSLTAQKYIFIAFLLAFAVKV
ncbi:MAG: NADH-quinone oxidoreductase subunit M, partial [Desulfobulbaceae bacterium]|nr:NADH-quinone oxidoreductase subunit M [Desulfobulbaceae bacterium]